MNSNENANIQTKKYYCKAQHSNTLWAGLKTDKQESSCCEYKFSSHCNCTWFLHTLWVSNSQQKNP
jgi:hypothetical protein